MASRKSSTSLSPASYAKKEKPSSVSQTASSAALSMVSNSSIRGSAQTDNEREREPLLVQIRGISENLVALNGARNSIKTKDRQTAYRTLTSRLLQIIQLAGDNLSSKDRYSILRERGIVSTLHATISYAGDNQVTTSILRTLIELTGRSCSRRRVRCLVRCGTTDVLIRVVMDASRISVWDDELMLTAHNALVIVGRRDKKFPLKIRLSGLLAVTVKLLKRYANNLGHSKMLLRLLKLTLQSPLSCVAIGKQDCYSALSKILFTCGCSHTAVARLALDVLRATLRASKQNAARAVRDGTVSVVLGVVLIGTRLSLGNVSCKQRDALRAMRLTALQCLRALIQADTGRASFWECGGLTQLFGICIRDPAFRMDDELAQCAVAILSRCTPLINLPLESARHPVSVTVFDDFISTSAPVIVTSCLQTEPPESAVTPIRRYGNASGSDSDEIESNVGEHPCDASSATSSPATQVQATSKSDRRRGSNQASKPAKATAATRSRPISITNGRSVTGEQLPDAEVDILDNDSTASTVGAGTEYEGEEQLPPAGDERDWQSLQEYSPFFAELDPAENCLIEIEQSTPIASTTETDSSQLGRAQRAQLYAELNSAYTHPVIPQLHTKLGYPDLAGHSYSPFSSSFECAIREPLHETRPQTVRRRILEDVARFVEPMRLLNNLVYDLDSLLLKDKDAPQNIHYTYTAPQLSAHATVVISLSGPNSSASCANTTVYDTNSYPPLTEPLENDDEKRVLSGEYWRDGSVPAAFGKPRAAANGSETTLQFESRFECGNLRRAVQVREFEYDLILNSDVGSNRPQQWFYFAVANTRPNVKYRFNILNFEKDRNMFASGMKPVIFSVQESLRGRSCWVRSGTEVCYYRNFYHRPPASSSSPGSASLDTTEQPPISASDAASTPASGPAAGTRYFTLSFVLKFKHRGDVVYIAYHYPYTYTTLRMHLHDWQLRAAALNRADSDSSEGHVFYREQTLCETLGGHRVPLLTITSASKNMQDTVAEPSSLSSTITTQTLDPPALQQLLNYTDVADADADAEQPVATGATRRRKHYVVITSRVHPSESNSSWVLRGIVDYLLGDSPTARALRDRFVFKIVPMLNPDGVVNGNTRYALTAEDLNRRWTRPSPVRHAAIYHAKGLLQYLRAIGQPPLLYCDLHGHARQRNVFIYGCDPLCSWLKDDYKIVANRNGSRQLNAMKTFPKLLHERCTAFNFANCNFKIQRAKESTARIVVWRQLGIVRSYTLEASFCGGERVPLVGSHFTSLDFELVGARFCEALQDLAAVYVDDTPPAADRVEIVDLLRSTSASATGVNCTSENNPVAPPSSANCDSHSQLVTHPYPLARQLLLRKTAPFVKLRLSSANAAERERRLLTGSTCQLPPLSGARGDHENAGLAKRLNALSLDTSCAYDHSNSASHAGASAAESDSADSENEKDSDEEEEDDLDSASDADVDTGADLDYFGDTQTSSIANATASLFVDEDDDVEPDGYDLLERQGTFSK